MTTAAVAESPVAVFGGTFDPVHNGHLRSALELAETLNLANVRMMPCANPPHRAAPGVSAEHRAAMLELAVDRDEHLSCDRRELNRDGRSYTIDSLIELRGELGAQRSLILVMGCDALLGITGWHRWDELLQWAHVVVVARPGWQLPARGPVADWVNQHSVDNVALLNTAAAGYVLLQELRQLPISASEIRALVAAGKSARFLLPEPVLDYILKNQLY
ncbi:MAG: nicotinate-nucleotide adenylyltransferase [Halioglobus sp.]